MLPRFFRENEIEVGVLQDVIDAVAMKPVNPWPIGTYLPFLSRHSVNQ
jgi:hypothetical protein